MTPGKKILVTGANGQVGKEIQAVCHSLKDYEFVFMSRADMPINQFDLVRHIFNTIKPAYCINCAAYTAVDKAESERDLAFEINGEAAGVLAAICMEHETRLIHISTDYVFDGNGKKPYKETDATAPVNTYGASKLEGEEEIFKYNPAAIIIRTSWVYSAFGSNFVKTMLRLMKEKKTINVVDDQWGSPTFAADLAMAMLQIIGQQEWKPGIYHFSNEGVINWFQFATAIKEIIGAEVVINPVPTSAYPTPAKRPAYSVLDKDRILQTFGITLNPWQESLANCINQIQNAP